MQSGTWSSECVASLGCIKCSSSLDSPSSGPSGPRFWSFGTVSSVSIWASLCSIWVCVECVVASVTSLPLSISTDWWKGLSTSSLPLPLAGSGAGSDASVHVKSEMDRTPPSSASPLSALSVSASPTDPACGPCGPTVKEVSGDARPVPTGSGSLPACQCDCLFSARIWQGTTHSESLSVAVNFRHTFNHHLSPLLSPMSVI